MKRFHSYPPPEAGTTRQDEPTRHGNPRHLVQFYSNEHSLFNAVGEYLSAGLASGQAVFVVAAQQRISAFSSALTARGIDVVQAVHQDRLAFAEAGEMLRTFLVDDRPDYNRFRNHVVPLLEHYGADRPGALRAYGEMVDVLWRAGKYAAALRLEELWDELVDEYAFEVLCAYSIDHFRRSADTEHFSSICARHGAVHVAEPTVDAAVASSHVRTVALLQQRTLALETEIEQRNELELQLRESLEQERAVESALRIARDSAERASRAKSDFLAVMSHELRTPLNAIIGYHDLLELGIGGALTREQSVFVDGIQNAAQVLLQLIDQVLSVTRLDAGKENINIEHADLRTVVQTASTLVEPAARTNGLLLQVITPNEPVKVISDVSKIRQVVLNLLSNAVKFTDSGLIQVEVTADDQDAFIAVKDSGIGIANEDAARIFEPFVQLDGTATRRYVGAGLGLAVSRGFARILGGDISVSSTSGQGSTFVFRLPRKMRSADATVQGSDGSEGLPATPAITRN